MVKVGRWPGSVAGGSEDQAKLDRRAKRDRDRMTRVNAILTGVINKQLKTEQKERAEATDKLARAEKHNRAVCVPVKGGSHELKLKIRLPNKPS